MEIEDEVYHTPLGEPMEMPQHGLGGARFSFEPSAAASESSAVDEVVVRNGDAVATDEAIVNNENDDAAIEENAEADEVVEAIDKSEEDTAKIEYKVAEENSEEAGNSSTSAESGSEAATSSTFAVSGGESTTSSTFTVSGGESATSGTSGVSGGESATSGTSGVSGGESATSGTSGVSGGEARGTGTRATTNTNNEATPGNRANHSAGINSTATWTAPFQRRRLWHAYMETIPDEDESGVLDESRPSSPRAAPRFVSRVSPRMDIYMMGGRGPVIFNNGIDLSNYNRKNWIRLNISGTHFISTRRTLCRDPYSFFSRLLDEESMLRSDTDETGAIMIDRDATYFPPVLNYLRHGKMILNKDMQEEGILEEAEFYNLLELIKIATEAIKIRDAKLPTVKKKVVYRVLQFNENELTEMLSSLSDGWRFEQLINIGQMFQYGQDNCNEYLCLVSRECDDVPDTSQLSDRVRYLQQKGSR